MDLQALNTELTIDPLGRNYDGMTDQQAADSLNAANRPVDVETVEGWQLWGATDLSEWNALSAANRLFWQALLAQQAIRVKDQTVRANALALFPTATFPNTRAALIALQTKTVSRAEELGLPFVRESDVKKARAL